MSTASFAGAGRAQTARRWREWLACAGALACLAGLFVHGLWQDWPGGRFAESLLIAAATAALAWPLRRWLGWTWASAIAAVGLLPLLLFAGPLTVLAALALVVAAFALGGVVADARFALPVGLALIAGVLGWLLPLPVHYRSAYVLAIAGLILWRRHALAGALGVLRGHWAAAAAAAPRASMWAMLVLVVASTGCWLPTMQYDDLAYHLGLPWQLQQDAEYALDPTHQVWALAPWAGDVLHAVVQVLAGAEARGAWNAVWLLMGAAGAHRFARALGATPWACWGAVALYASLPLTAALAGGMQTELPAAAITLALACLVVEGGDDARRSLLLGAILVGLLCALKSIHAATALPLLAWAAWRHRHALPWRLLPLGAVVVLAVGGSSYAYAWSVAGNPFLPLLNATFASPFFPVEDFTDQRWQAGLDGAIVWSLTFQTDRYLEGWSGAFGFVLVALSGVWLLALSHARTRAPALVATAGLFIALLPLQYARYLYPPLALLVPVLATTMGDVLGKRAAVALLAAVCALDVAFLVNANWTLRGGAVKETILAAGEDAPLLDHYVPERSLVAAMRARGAGTGQVLVLGANPPVLAELGARGRNVSWYAPRMQAAAMRADDDAQGTAWGRLLHDEGVSHVLLRPQTLNDARRAALGRVGAQRRMAVGDAEWWEIPREAAP